MSSTEQPSEAIARLIVEHIRKYHEWHRSSTTSGSRTPIFIGIQGPQGAGKTTVTRAVLASLASGPQPLSVASLSLDDLYLPHSGLVEVSERCPGNGLLKGRGQPGTHDVELGEYILKTLRDINDDPSADVEIPVFEKSLFNGEGDRLPPGSGPIVKAPVDIVILEGWCWGFYPLEDADLEKKYKELSSVTPASSDSLPDLSSIFKSYSLEDIRAVNQYLRGYAQKLYPYFSVFVEIRAAGESPLSPIYKWRLQQEHHMKSLNGGRGMSDEDVKLFIDRYIPGYVFFSEGIEKGYNTGGGPADETQFPPWRGRLLRVTIQEDRQIQEVAKL